MAANTTKFALHQTRETQKLKEKKKRRPVKPAALLLLCCVPLTHRLFVRSALDRFDFEGLLGALIMEHRSSDTWVTVHSSTPHLPSSASRPPVTTLRLLIRPLQASDLAGLHKLRTQPDVMRWSVAGRTDFDTDETAQKLACFLPPKDNQAFNCAICWKETGDFIGIGGMYQLNRVDLDLDLDVNGSGPPDEGGFGWPELGYMFLKEYWGMGLATEFLKAFLQMWQGLERTPVEMRVNRLSLVDDSVVTDDGGGSDTAAVKERLVAVVDAANGASQRILEKCGFDKFAEFEQRHPQDPDKTLTLHGFRWRPNI